MSDSDRKIPPELEAKLARLAIHGEQVQEAIRAMHAGGLSASEAFWLLISGACAVLSKTSVDLMAEELPSLPHKMATITGIYRAMDDHDSAREMTEAVLARMKSEKSS